MCAFLLFFFAFLGLCRNKKYCYVIIKLYMYICAFCNYSAIFNLEEILSAFFQLEGRGNKGDDRDNIRMICKFIREEINLSFIFLRKKMYNIFSFSFR